MSNNVSNLIGVFIILIFVNGCFWLWFWWSSKMIGSYVRRKHEQENRQYEQEYEQLKKDIHAKIIRESNKNS